MKRIYLAIPYTGMEEKSFETVNRIAGGLMSDGNLVFSPISHSHPIAELCDLPGDHDYWRAWNESFLVNWADEVHVVMVDGWLESSGVQWEIKRANELGLQVCLIGE